MREEATQPLSRMLARPGSMSSCEGQEAQATGKATQIFIPLPLIASSGSLFKQCSLHDDFIMNNYKLFLRWGKNLPYLSRLCAQSPIHVVGKRQIQQKFPNMQAHSGTQWNGGVVCSDSLSRCLPQPSLSLPVLCQRESIGLRE